MSSRWCWRKSSVTVAGACAWSPGTAPARSPGPSAWPELAVETVTVEAKVYDAKGILCLDARNRLRFSVAGTGSLIDNRGTSKASRVVEMYNGRAEISLTRKEGGSVVAVSTAGIKPAFCNIA